MASTMFILSILMLISSISGEEEFNLDNVDRYEIAPPYFAATVSTTSYILPVLKWSNGLLEPFIDRKTIDAHYYGHHNTYTLKLNAALEEWNAEYPEDEYARKPIMNILQDLSKIPDKFFTAIVNNGGGYVNHAFYWACMSYNLEENPTAREPTGALAEEIKETFGDYQAFREEFTKAALSKFGSGYTWLIRRPAMAAGRQLAIISTDNQDCPLSVGEQPLLVIDIWEHAYYLKHQYRRAAYIEDWWMVVDWENVDELNNFWRDGMKLGKKYFRRLPSDIKEDDEQKEEL